jgi:TatA/E family protein of Tat protein translocase
MMNFGPIKLLFTAVAALLILGPKRLPAAVRSLGRALGELKKASAEVTEELKAGFDAGTDDPLLGLPPSLPGPRASFPPTPTPASTTGPPEEELRPGPR